MNVSVAPMPARRRRNGVKATLASCTRRASRAAPRAIRLRTKAAAAQRAYVATTMLLRSEATAPSVDMAAPRGRPPAGYRYVGGIFVHIETGTPFDSGLRAALVHAKKLACLKA